MSCTAGLCAFPQTARQLILHGHFSVNSKPTDVPSVLLRAGDVISVNERSKKLEVIHNAMKRMKDSSMLHG